MSCLTKERLDQLLKYDSGSGEFTWLMPTSNRAKVGAVAGALHPAGYKRVGVDGKSYLLHRLVMLHSTGEMPKYVDHIDGDRSNNRVSNLRSCTNQENAFNSSAHKGSELGVKNVYKTLHGRYSVRISKKYYGTYEDLELAQHIATEVRDHLHGEFARHA